MNGSQLMGLDSVGTEIYDIHEYFRKLTIGQRTPEFWGVTWSGWKWIEQYLVMFEGGLGLNKWWKDLGCVWVERINEIGV